MARTILEFEYNRNRGVKMTPLEVSFLTGDKNGHEFHVRIVDKEGPVDLSGCVVKGMFIADDRGREDDITVDLTGRVDGNNAILPLKEECYALTGRFSLAIKVGRGDDTLATVFWATGNVLRSGTEQRTVPETLTYLPVNGKAADAAKLDGKAPEYYIQLENQLDNSDFEVAQAGYNGLHGNELYHADRWWGNGIGSLSVSGTVKTFASISGFAIMKQNLWNDGRDHGKTYTLVVTLPDGTRLVGSGKSPSAPSTSEQVFIDITAPDSRCWFMVMKGANDVMCVRVDASQTGSAVSFLSIDLFEGAYTVESAPPHTPPDPLTELEKCHFYFRRLKGMNWAVFGTGSVRLTHRADFFIPLGKMRIDNVSIRTQGAFTITVAGASFPPASITLDVFGRSNIGIIVTADTGEHLLSSYLGQTALLQANDNAETYIDISADL